MSKEEFREVAKRLFPELTDEEFDAMWARFVEEKYRRSLH